MPKNNTANHHTLLEFINHCLSISPEVGKELLRESKRNNEEWGTYASGMLIAACQMGRLDLVNMLLEEGANVEQQLTGIFPIHMACEYGHKNIVEVLLGAGANIEVTYESTGETPLYIASEKGHKEIVDLLLAWGAKMETPRFDSTTALMTASINNHVDIVEVLLKSGANVNVVMNQGRSILLETCGKGHEKVVALLLEFNAAMEVSDEQGLTPIYVACRDGHTSVVKMLLARNVNIEVQTKEGAKPLWRASQNGHTDIVELLLAAGAEVECRTDLSSATPLYIASQNGHTEVVRKLLLAGANTENRRDDGYETPFFAACRNNHVDIVEILWKAGAEVNVIDSYGSTAFFVACQRGFTDLVKILLQAGANIEHTVQDGLTPLMLACQEGHEDIVIELLKKGANVKAKHDKGVNALYFACKNKHIDIAKRVLEVLLSFEGGSSNLSTWDYNYIEMHSELKIFLAKKIMEQMNGQEKMDILSLMPSGFDDEDLKKILRGAIKKNLLCWGSIKNLQKYYEALKKHGFDLNMKDRMGITLLDAACSSGDVNVMKNLLKDTSVEKTEEDLKAVEDSLERNKKKSNTRQRSSVKKAVTGIRDSQKPSQEEVPKAPSSPPKVETVNEAFLRKYFSSLLKLVGVNIQKDDKFFMLSLSKKPSQSDEEFESLQALFKEECARIFNSAGENDAIRVSLDTKKPQESTSKISYENFVFLKTRYSPAKVSIDFTGSSPCFVISTDNLKSPYTEQGRALWIAAVERELSRVASMRMGYKEGKVYKIPVSSLPSSLELPTPFINSLLETLLEQYCKPSEIVYLKNTFITFLKEGKYSLESDSKKSSGVKFSSKSSAHFLYFLLQKMFSFNMSVRENKEETKFAVVISEQITAERFLTMQDSPVNVRDFLNDIEKLKSYYSLQEFELVLKDGSLGILLKAQDKEMLSYIQRDLQEKSYEGALHEEGFFIKDIPKASKLKGSFAQSRKQFEKETKDQQDREAKAKALEEKQKKKQEKKNSPPKETVKRPVMKPAPQQPVSQGKNTSYTKIHRGTYGGENSQGRRVYNRRVTLEDLKAQFDKLKQANLPYKDSFNNTDNIQESEKQRIYFDFYLNSLILFNDWYEYLKGCENSHHRHNTPFNGNAEDMMRIRLYLSYCVAKNNMVDVLSRTFKEFNRVGFENGAGIFSAEFIFSDEKSVFLNTKNRVGAILSCFTTLVGFIKNDQNSVESLKKYFKQNPKDFYFAKSLMVASVQLYRESLQEMRRESALFPYKTLLQGDLKNLRDDAVHNNPVNYTAEELAELIVKIREIDNKKAQPTSQYPHGESSVQHFRQSRKNRNEKMRDDVGCSSDKRAESSNTSRMQHDCRKR